MLEVGEVEVMRLEERNQIADNQGGVHVVHVGRVSAAALGRINKPTVLMFLYMMLQ